MKRAFLGTCRKTKGLLLTPLAAGMRLLPEEERLDTLNILAKNKQEVERALQVSLRDCVA